MRDDSAVAQPLAFLIAGVIFISAVGALLVTTGDLAGEADKARSEQSSLQGDAENLLDILLGSTGITDADNDWLPRQDEAGAPAPAPDDVARLGLLNGTTGYIDFEKLENLRLAPLRDDGTGDGYANYEEVRAAFGFEQAGLDFHVRAKPSLKSVEELLAAGVRDPTLRVTYLADIERGGTTKPTTTSFTCTAGPGSETLRIATTVENTGDGVTQFHGVFEVTVNGVEVEDDTNTFHVDPQGVVPLYIDVAAYGDCDSVSEVELELYDPSTRLDTLTWTTPFSPVGGIGVAQEWVRIDPDRLHYADGDLVVLEYDGALEGQQNNNDDQYDTVTLTIKDGAGNPVAFLDAGGNTVYSESQIVPAQANQRRFSIGPLGQGEYTVSLAIEGTGVVSTDRILVLPGTQVPVPDFAVSTSAYSYSPAAVEEVSFLAGLVDRFCPDEYGSDEGSFLPSRAVDDGPWNTRCRDIGNPPHFPEKGQTPVSQFGDVFPDQKKVLNEELPKRLVHGDDDPRYDITNVLVVGSNVDHNTMTSNVAKDAVHDWVLGGGTLIVFGSEDQVVQWLQPIFHSGIEPSGGGLTAPDTSHPLLHVADDLLWEGFVTGSAWSLQQNGQPDAPANLFTPVVGTNAEAALTISDPGAYGAGTIILTSWLPYDLFGDGSAAGAQQGRFLVNNLLMQGYRDLFLDYGPPLPAGSGVTPAWGTAQVLHPELGLVALDVTVFVFRG